MGIWSQASALAARTPQERNRYVDFLRAASILFVITGHWLITTAYSGGGDFAAVMMLDARPWTQWLTWVFQVMPIFFIVGGYSNAVSLESARRRNTRYAAWLAGRLHRLLTPLLLLVMFWAVISLLLNLGGLPAETVAFASRFPPEGGYGWPAAFDFAVRLGVPKKVSDRDLAGVGDVDTVIMVGGGPKLSLPGIVRLRKLRQVALHHAKLDTLAK